MNPTLRTGITGELEVRVTPDMAPDYAGRIVHPVCSTWSITRHMEKAGRQLLLPYLEPHEELVGTHVSADHTAPARIGRTLRIVSEVAEIQGNKVRCLMRVCAGRRTIARGEIVLAVLPKDRLRRLFERS